MYYRDKFLLIAGLLIVAVGSILTVVWHISAGIVAILFLCLLCMILLVLQRRQLSKVQQRTLAILRTPAQHVPQVDVSACNDCRQDMTVYTKKIVGMLQAQQTSMEILNDKFENKIERDG